MDGETRNTIAARVLSMGAGFIVGFCALVSLATLLIVKYAISLPLSQLIPLIFFALVASLLGGGYIGVGFADVVLRYQHYCGRFRCATCGQTLHRPGEKCKCDFKIKSN